MYLVYGKAPPRQLHTGGMPIAVSGSGHTREQIDLFDAVYIPGMQESPPHKWFLVHSRTQLALS